MTKTEFFNAIESLKRRMLYEFHVKVGDEVKAIRQRDGKIIKGQVFDITAKDNGDLWIMVKVPFNRFLIIYPKDKIKKIQNTNII